MRPALAALVLSAGCASAPQTHSAGGAVRLDVPYFVGDSGQRGASALASVLGFWGKPALPAPLLDGAAAGDMTLAAQSRGLRVETLEPELGAALKDLDAGRPVIAFVRRGFFSDGRWLVLTGYDDASRVVLAHTGRGRDARLSFSSFDRAWRRGGRRGLSIRPKTPQEEADALVAVGRAAYAEGHLDTAEAAFREALTAVPRDPVALKNLALTLSAPGAALVAPPMAEARRELEQLKSARDAIQSSAKERDHLPGEVPRR